MTDTNKTTVKTNNNRTLTVTDYDFSDDVYLRVSNHYNTQEISSALTRAEAKTLAGALLGNNVAVITNLPEAKDHGYGYVYAGNVDRHRTNSPDEIEELAKNLLAIAKFIRKANAEKEAAEAKRVAEAEAEAAIKAEKEAADKRDARRDELASEFRGYKSTYSDSSHVFKKSIDRVIELEDAAAKAKTKPLFQL